MAGTAPVIVPLMTEFAGGLTPPDVLAFVQAMVETGTHRATSYVVCESVFTIHHTHCTAAPSLTRYAFCNGVSFFVDFCDACLFFFIAGQLFA